MVWYGPVKGKGVGWDVGAKGGGGESIATYYYY